MNGRPDTYAHFMVAKVARELAGAFYEEFMRTDTHYAEWKQLCPELTGERLQEMFIQKMWPYLLQEARATLAKMLAGPYPDALKADITDALIKDNTLRKGRLH